MNLESSKIEFYVYHKNIRVRKFLGGFYPAPPPPPNYLFTYCACSINLASLGYCCESFPVEKLLEVIHNLP